MSAAVERRGGSGGWAALPLVVAVLLVSSIWLRYSGPWAESDTVTMTRTIRGVFAQETIEPRGLAYSNGFNYSTLAAVLAGVTGLPIRSVQTTLLPWLLPVTALVAFIAFRAVTGSGRFGAVCALLLLIQADFLFVMQRGSHEKITWMFVLLVIFAFVRSVREPSSARAAPFVATVYLAGFAIVCTNVFFASSFITMLVLCLAIGAVSARWVLRDRQARRILPRFGYTFLTLGILTYVFMTVLYPTAQSNLDDLRDATDRIGVLYLGQETKPAAPPADGTDATAAAEGPSALTRTAPPSPPPQEVRAQSPYRTIANVWVNQEVFLLLTGFTWLLLLYAFISWLLILLRFLRSGVPEEELPLFMTWALAAAAGAQIAASVAADFAGIFGGNLQLRLFPAFTLFAIPLVVSTLRLPARPLGRLLRWAVPALAIVGFSAVATAFPAYALFAVPIILVALHFHGRSRLSGQIRPYAIALGATVFVAFAVAATLKATNDPLVSNRWMFYSQAEEATLRWGEANLGGALVWSEFDERVAAASVLLEDDLGGSPGTPTRWTRGLAALEESPYLMISDVTVDRALRTARPAPDVRKEDVVYDNGGVFIAHRPPLTAYQP